MTFVWILFQIIILYILYIRKIYSYFLISIFQNEMNFSIILKLFLLFSVGTADENVLPLLMPNISTDRIHEDSYLCTSYTTKPNEAEYITEFKPNASFAESLHHMVIMGCETLPEYKARDDQDNFWECSSDVSITNCGPGKNTLLYVWSRNAPTFALPDGVGIKIGGDTKINYLVLHVHYFNLAPDKSRFAHW